MQIVDIHTHLYPEPDMDAESSLSNRRVDEIARDYARRIEASPVDHAVAIVMDGEFLQNDEAVTSLCSVRDETGVFSLVFLIDPTRDDAAELVELAADADAVGVKFHPYLHRLGPDTYPDIERLGSAIENSGLLTIVDCSYGSEYHYEANGVELGHELARVVDSPVLLTHGGGPRVLDAFAATEAMANVYVDTSFSLKYWEGSTVIQDYGFVAGEIDDDRFLWGSDHPYVDQRESLKCARSFADSHVTNKAAYFGTAAMELLNL